MTIHNDDPHMVHLEREGERELREKAALADKVMLAWAHFYARQRHMLNDEACYLLSLELKDILPMPNEAMELLEKHKVEEK